jgi:hypothetical protein
MCEIILITEDQVNNFVQEICFEVRGTNDKRYLIMST